MIYSMPALSGAIGTTGKNVKPVNDGVVGVAPSKDFSTYGWGVLDSVTESVSSALGNVVNSYGNKESKKLTGGAETVIDSTGSNEQQVTGQIKKPGSLMTQYKMPLLVIGALLVGFVAYRAIK
jgi:hypothetical protein